MWNEVYVVRMGNLILAYKENKCKHKNYSQLLRMLPEPYEQCEQTKG